MRRSAVRAAAMAAALCMLGLVWLLSRRGEPGASREPERGPSAPAQPESPVGTPGGSAATSGAERPAEEEPGALGGDAVLVARVVDAETGAALAAERISIVLTWFQAPASRRKTRASELTTDGAGRFRLPGLRPGEYSLLTKHPDYVPDSRIVRLSGETGSEPGAAEDLSASEVLIPLQSADALSGQVIDSRGEPIQGAFVRLAFRGSSLEGVSVRTETDGTFLCRGLRRGQWQVSAAREGYRLRQLSVEVPAPEPLRIELSEDPGFEVIVLVADGSPIAGARVVSLRRTWGVPGVRRSGVTDAQGRVRLPGLPEDPTEEFQIQVAHPDHGRLRTSVRAADLDPGPYRVTLGASLTVRGTVVEPSGQGVPNAEVRLERADGSLAGSVRTLATGAFEFRGIPEGKYSLVALSKNSGAGILEGLELGPGSADRSFEIQLLQGGAAVAGKVLDSEGKPQALCPLSLEIRAEGRKLVFETASAPDGTFRFEGLPGEIGASCLLGARTPRGKRETRYEVRLGDLNLIVRLDQPGSVRGFLPGEGAMVSYTIVLAPLEGSTSGLGSELRFQFTGGRRDFHLREIPPGTYSLTVLEGEKPRWRAAEVEVLPGKETGPVELSAVPGG